MEAKTGRSSPGAPAAGSLTERAGSSAARTPERAWSRFFDTRNAAPVEQLVDGETYLLVDAARRPFQRTLLMEGDEPYMGSRTQRPAHLFAIGFARNASNGRRSVVIYRHNTPGHFHVRGASAAWNWVFWAEAGSSTPATEWQINWHDGGYFSLSCELESARLSLCAHPGQSQWLFAGNGSEYEPLRFRAYAYRSSSPV